MAILSWRISWMTTSRSVRFPRSTSGRAPSISSSMRFWISAVSLNRPPTLFTISSLFNASIICASTSLKTTWGLLVTDQAGDLLDRPIHAVVDHHVVERAAAFGHPDLALRATESLFHLLVGLAATFLQTMQQRLLIRRHDEDHQRVRILKT